MVLVLAFALMNIFGLSNRRSKIVLLIIFVQVLVILFDIKMILENQHGTMDKDDYVIANMRFYLDLCMVLSWFA